MDGRFLRLKREPRILIALAGLHGSGKSVFATLVKATLGRQTHNKRDLILALSPRGHNQTKWYRALYQDYSSYQIMATLMGRLDRHAHTILDSVHTVGEWRAIQELWPTSALVAVVAPKTVRDSRNQFEDGNHDNAMRLARWHDDNGCLMSEVDGCINGAATPELQLAELTAVLEHRHSR